MPESIPATTTHDFLVPDLGEGLEDATLVEWKVAVGDEVALNQPLCVLETAKAEVEIPSPFAGRVVECNGAPGDVLDVGSILARIEPSDRRAAPSASTTDDGGTATADTSRDASGSVLVGYGTSTGTSRRRRARRPDAGSQPSPTPAAANGRGATQSDVTGPGTTKARAKPKTRRLARDLGIDIDRLTPGSGPDGRVTRNDVLAADATRTDSSSGSGSGSGSEGDDVVPLVGVRARIADHLTRAHQQIPAASAWIDVDCSRLLDVRATLNADAERRGADPVITPFSLLLHLLVRAVGRNPTLNASFDSDARTITTHRDIHLGVGTATDRGLVVPVVRSAQDRSLLDLSAEVRRLAGAARDGTLAPTEMVGSTITVSNFGALGLDAGTPIINAPEAAIVGVGAILERPVAIAGQLEVRPTCTITCTFDHRVSDGSEIGAFLGDVRSLVLEPARAL